MSLVLFFAAGALLAEPGRLTPDPLEPSRRGMVSCVDPDIASKTCMAIYRYSWDGDAISFAVTMLVNAPGHTVMEAKGHLYYRGDLSCSRRSFKPEEIVGATIDGAPADERALADLRERATAVLKPFDGLEYCVGYEPRGDDGFITRVFVENVRRPESDNTMRWVSPDEGWRVP